MHMNMIYPTKCSIYMFLWVLIYGCSNHCHGPLIKLPITIQKYHNMQFQLLTSSSSTATSAEQTQHSTGNSLYIQIPSKDPNNIYGESTVRGVATDFRVGGGTNRRQVANLHPKYPKNRKSPDLGHFIFESGGDVPS